MAVLSAVVGVLLVALMSAEAAAQTRPASEGGAASATPRMPDGKLDLNGRWGGGGGGPGGGAVQAIEPDGKMHEFEHYSDYAAALAAGRITAAAKIVGRQPNY